MSEKYSILNPKIENLYWTLEIFIFMVLCLNDTLGIFSSCSCLIKKIIEQQHTFRSSILHIFEANKRNATSQLYSIEISMLHNGCNVHLHLSTKHTLT